MTNPRVCPVCSSAVIDSDLFQEENIDLTRISNFSFASRKIPEFMCHKLVRCRKCDLVYVCSPPASSELAQAYHVADYDSSEEAEDAADAYIKAMKPVFQNVVNKHDALEIGAGTGILLELLKKEGFINLIGVEPSAAAILAAPKYRREWLQESIFEENNFKPNSFDIICCFMTMEHVYDPGEIARSAFNLLRPGGVFVTVTHDYKSLVNKLLGKRSPIIDIEHMQLFSSKSIRYLFAKNGYEDISVRDFKNNYALKYWFRLTPFPQYFKSIMLSFMKIVGVDNIKFSINVGNIICYGFKRGR